MDEREISFEPVDDGACDVLVDGAVAGRLVAREQPGLNRVKDYRYSGNPKDGRARRVVLWEATVQYVDALDEIAKLRVQHEIKRGKTDRKAATAHLLAAYEKAGVPLPPAPLQAA